MSETNLQISEKIGEVTRSGISAIVITSLYQDKPKTEVTLGSLIKTESLGCSALAVIANIEHVSAESNRVVSPLGMSKQKLKEEMGHLFELINVSYTALVVGYKTREGNILQGLPPSPPELHDFAFQATDQEQELFFNNGSAFVRIMLKAVDVPSPDEVIIAFLKKYAAVIGSDKMTHVGRALSYVLGADFRRLESLLERIAIEY